MKTVSIVIPTFNQDRYLPACVDNCLFQTYDNLEIIIVDGGSTDGTKAYLSGIERQIASRTMSPVISMDTEENIIRKEITVYPDNRKITILSFDEDIGPTNTYNEGLSRATGEYCTYIVGDDLPHPHMIEEMVNAIETTGADFIYSDMNLVDDHGRIVRQMRLPDYNFETCFAEWYHLGVSKLYRTKWHQEVGLMDEAYQGANDYDHYLRFATAGAEFYHLSRVIYSVRHHGDDRRVGQHTESRYINLLNESRKCALRARKWLEEEINEDTAD